MAEMVLRVRLVKSAEVAERLGVTQQMVTKMARTGVIRGLKVGSDWRFYPDSIDEYIRSRLNQPAAVAELVTGSATT